MLKWGIYGAGEIAKGFAADFSRVSGVKLVAAYARKKEKVAVFCKVFNIEKAYNNEEDFFNDPEIEVVYIATPHALHYQGVMKAIKAGKHVLCEKPFALNAKQTKAMFALAKEENVFVMEALWTLFLPTIKKVMSWLQQGRIGTLKAIEGNFGFVGKQDPNGRLMNLKLGGGALLDVGIYPVLMANYINKSVPLSIVAKSKMTETGVDASTFMIFQYANGIIASLNASIEVQMVNTLYIYGSQGHIEVPVFWMADEARLICDGKIESFVAELEDQHGYFHEIKGVCEAINNKNFMEPSVSHEFTEKLMETLDRVRQAIGLKYELE